VVGRAFIYDPQDLWIEERAIAPDEVETEIERFLAAIERARDDLKATQARLATELAAEGRHVLEAHVMILEDPVAIEQTIARIRTEQVAADFAFFRTLRGLIKALRAAKDDYLRERAGEVRAVGRRVFHLLANREPPAPRPADANAIIVARTLGPADAAQLSSIGIRAFVTDLGGPTSHAAIVARSLDVPAVVGAKRASELIEPGEHLIVDGSAGVVYREPDEPLIAQTRIRQAEDAATKQKLRELRELPCETLDGRRVGLLANIEIPEEIALALDYGAEGIGLYRTEFLHLLGDRPPSEDEQFEAFARIVRDMAPRPVTIRTLDVGGDKALRSEHIDEANPFLGWRAIRFCLDQPDLFGAHLRAILRASAIGPVRLMLPMVAGLEELNDALTLLEGARDQLRRARVPFDPELPVGIMVEVPSAAVTIDRMAGKVAFLSLGTNDLIQYTLAVDRDNARIARYYDPMHLGFLRLVRNVIETGQAHGLHVSTCGETCEQFGFAVLLLGMGLDEFSMTPQMIPRIKRLFRSIRYDEARRLTDEVFALDTAREIRARVEAYLRDAIAPPIVADMEPND
jgi:phosphotransferase system enzyme I (PtsI)